MKLIEVPTEHLTRELRLRSRCCDCGTEWSRGWYTADGERRHRIRCFDCEGRRRLKAKNQHREHAGEGQRDLLGNEAHHGR